MGGPPLLSTFGAIRAAKFPFLKTANRTREITFASNRKKRFAHLLQNCSTKLPLVRKSPNGGRTGGNKLISGAETLNFSAKSRVSLLTDKQRTERRRRTPPHGRFSSRVRACQPPHSNKCKMEYFVTFPASAVAREGLRGMGGTPPFEQFWS